MINSHALQGEKPQTLCQHSCQVIYGLTVCRWVGNPECQVFYLSACVRGAEVDTGRLSAHAIPLGGWRKTAWLCDTHVDSKLELMLKYILNEETVSRFATKKSLSSVFIYPTASNFRQTTDSHANSS